MKTIVKLPEHFVKFFNRYLVSNMKGVLSMFGKQKKRVPDDGDEVAVVRCGSVREVLDGVPRGSHDVRCLKLGGFSVYMDADRVVNACEGEESFAPMFAECFPELVELSSSYDNFAFSELVEHVGDREGLERAYREYMWDRLSDCDAFLHEHPQEVFMELVGSDDLRDRVHGWSFGVGVDEPVEQPEYSPGRIVPQLDGFSDADELVNRRGGFSRAHEVARLEGALSGGDYTLVSESSENVDEASENLTNVDEDSESIDEASDNEESVSEVDEDSDTIDETSDNVDEVSDNGENVSEDDEGVDLSEFLTGCVGGPSVCEENDTLEVQLRHVEDEVIVPLLREYMSKSGKYEDLKFHWHVAALCNDDESGTNSVDDDAEMSESRQSAVSVFESLRNAEEHRFLLNSRRCHVLGDVLLSTDRDDTKTRKAIVCKLEAIKQVHNKAFDVPVRRKPTGPTPLYDALVKYYGFDPLDEVS